MSRADSIVVDLRVERPEFALDVAFRGGGVLAVGGRSGSGKSTLLRAIAGLERATGQLSVGGETWLDGGITLPPEQRSIGALMQSEGLFPHMSAMENVGFGVTKGNRRSRRARAVDLLGDLGLKEQADAAVTKLSGGQRRRVALARALADDRRIYLLDEPFAGLDARTADQAAELIERRLREAGAAAVIAGHDAERLARISDRSILLADGRMIALSAAGSTVRAHVSARGGSPRNTARTQPDCRESSR